MTWTEALPLLLAVIAFATSALALLKGRNKEKADVTTAITDAVGKLLKEYRLKIDEIEEEYRARIEEYRLKIEEIEKVVAKQAEKIRSQDHKIAQQSGELVLQQIALDGQAVRITDLEDERSEIMDGVRALCTQIRNLGHEPVWEPDLK